MTPASRVVPYEPSPGCGVVVSRPNHGRDQHICKQEGNSDETADRYGRGVVCVHPITGTAVGVRFGQPKMDRETGLPLWQVQLMALDASGGDVIAVTVPGDPNVTVGQPAQVEGLVALPWSQEGRSGIAFRADAIRASGAPLAGVIAPPRTATPTGTSR